MKDTVITAKRKRTEVTYLLLSLLSAYALNILSIIIYDTSWKELYTSIPVVLVFGVVIYVISVLIRLTVWGIGRIFR